MMREMAQVFFASDSDPVMQRAKEGARASFRYFWRELAWERRRIVPALDIAAVKVAFYDPPPSSESRAEEMWIGDVDFDGRFVRGTLLNAPNWLKSIREGDEATVPLHGFSDWMFAIDGRIRGGFTVNAIRARMSATDRAAHDDAWGFDFGDPSSVFVAVELGADGRPLEHPMALNMKASLAEYVRKDPAGATAKDARGWSMLHHLALAGTKTGVSVLLDHGVDPNARANDGTTALDLARTLGWDDVVETLVARGAT